ncbi:MAG: hypothetical protein KBC91_05300, partial [Candidatus Omnitrophica bacterium]|nr:hypothetical protein [Candidatus Omnitrophota bacterium]
MKLGLLGLRAVAIVLSGSCLCLAAGGVFQSLADIHFKQGDYAKAAHLSRQSLRYNLGHFDSLMLLGLSDWKQWLQTKDAKALVRASKNFKTLTRVHAGDAKGWFYKALSEKNVLQLHGTLTESERYRINQEFNRAQALEPYSPWMAVFTALEILENTPAERRVKQEGPLLKRIRWALRQHYSDQASPYLEDVYSRLLTMGYASKVLQQVTPKEARSYFQLLQFYKSNRDYDLYSQVEIRYETMKNKFYSRLCEQADGWLEQGDLRRAEAAYRFAQIQRPWAARAQAGLFASEAKLSIGSPDVLKAVEALLIQEEEDLSFYWAYLASAVKDSRSLFLEGLFDFRQGQYSQAVQALQNVEAAK